MLFGRKQKNPIKIADKGVVEWKYATCGYCSTGCSIEVGLDSDGEPVASRGVADADVNRGKLCVKGIFEHELFRKTAGRGSVPLMRTSHENEFEEVPPLAVQPFLEDRLLQTEAFQKLAAIERHSLLELLRHAVFHEFLEFNGIDLDRRGIEGHRLPIGHQRLRLDIRQGLSERGERLAQAVAGLLVA